MSDPNAADAADAPFVLLRWTERRDASPDDIVVVGIFDDLDAVRARIDRVAAANPQYPMRSIGTASWRIGPDEDEGFFGNRAICFIARQPKDRPKPPTTRP